MVALLNRRFSLALKFRRSQAGILVSGLVLQVLNWGLQAELRGFLLGNFPGVERGVETPGCGLFLLLSGTDGYHVAVLSFKVLLEVAAWLRIGEIEISLDKM